MWHQSFRSWTATLTLAASASLSALAAPSFTLIPVDAPGLQTANFAWADFDNDGDLDVLAGGSSTTLPELILLTNNNGYLSPGPFTARFTLTGACAWMDYDGDGDLDFASGGFSNYPEDTSYPPLNARIFRNDGPSGFTPLGTEIPITGIPTWGDFDRDGDPDLLIAGAAPGEYSSSEFDPRSIHIYLNQPGAPWTLTWALALPSNSKPPVVADWNHDGWLDIAFVYNRMDDIKSLAVWHGAPNLEFTLTESDFSGYVWPYVLTWNDFDNDGDLDAAFTGEVSLSRTLSLVLNTPGGNNLSPLDAPGGFAITSADLNNDGLLDLLSTEGSDIDLASFFRLHTNLGTPPWFNHVDLPFRGAGFSTISCADYDLDGDNDILVSGFTNWTPSLRLLRNNLNLPNPPPSTPANLQSQVDPQGSVLFTWSPSNDANQPGGLTYNIRAGLSPASNDLVPSNTDTLSSRLLIPQRGNAGSLTSLTLTNLLAGTYHWSVQAVDNAFKTSSFAPESYFIIPPGPPRKPQCTATDIRFQHATFSGSAIPNGAETLLWFDYGTTENFGSSTPPVPIGSSTSPLSITNEISTLETEITYYFRLAASNSVATAYSPTQSLLILNTPPTHNLAHNGIVTTPVNTPAEPIQLTIQDLETPPENLQISTTLEPSFTDNPQLITANNILLAGSGPNRTITLTPTPNERGTLRIRLTITDEHNGSTSVYLILKTEDFTRTQSLPPNLGTSFAWVDVDHDSWPDLLGNLKWIQNTSGTNLLFRSMTQGTTVTGSMQILDAEADGWIDFAVTGTHLGEYLTQIFTNRQATDSLPTAFRPLPATLLPGFEAGPLSAVDYDQDGDTDLVAFGSTNFTPASAFASQTWRNDGNHTFTRIPSILPKLSLGSMTWADFDADGNIDVLVSGSTNRQVNGAYTDLLLNDGTGHLTPANLSLPQLSSGFVITGDIDNDNDLDLVLAGTTMVNNRPTSMGFVLQQNSSRQFEETLTLPAFTKPAGILVDADNDGDLDLFYAGQDGQLPITILRFFINDGQGNFTRVAEPEASPPWPLAFGDYDQDSDLDLATPTLLYKNLTQNKNTPPTSPEALLASVQNSSVSLQWNPSTDPNQPGGLTYNLRVGTAPQGIDTLSPLANPTTGARYVTAPGNTSLSTTWSLNNLAPGTYYWSVQAIDHSFAPSPFATEHSFTIPEPNTLAFASIQSTPPHNITLHFNLPNPTTCTLESSTDLTNWTPTDTLSIPAGPSSLQLPPQPNTTLFYRLRSP
ncbi:MAG: hypothetical protein RI897_3997 [Verrucomicrobiota bacterium]